MANVDEASIEPKTSRHNQTNVGIVRNWMMLYIETRIKNKPVAEKKMWLRGIFLSNRCTRA
jgi:hypothetical protein